MSFPLSFSVEEVCHELPAYPQPRSSSSELSDLILSHRGFVTSSPLSSSESRRLSRAPRSLPLILFSAEVSQRFLLSLSSFFSVEVS